MTVEESNSKIEALDVREAYKELRWSTRVVATSGYRFFWDDGFTRAAALAYTSLLSLVPALALGFGILASFAVSNQYVPAVREFLFKQIIPSDKAVEIIIAYIAEFSNAFASLNLLVVGVLVFTSLLLLNSIEYALNAIWQVFEPRSILHRIGIFSATILIAPFLALSAYYFTKFRLDPLIAFVALPAWMENFYRVLLPLMLDILVFTFLYFGVPKAPVKISSALFGAFVAGILFNAAKFGFAYYLSHFASYDTVYKTLSALPITLFWLYLVWSIVLYGAEVSYQYQNLPRNGFLSKRTVTSVGDAGFVLAIQVVAAIAHAFRAGEKNLNDIELSEKLRVSSVVLKPIIDKLIRAGILTRGDSRHMPVLLQKSPELCSLIEIREALYLESEKLSYLSELSKVYSSLAQGADVPKDRQITIAEIIKKDPIIGIKENEEA